MMAESSLSLPRRHPFARVAVLASAILALALVLTIRTMQLRLPGWGWLGAILSADPSDIRQVIVHDSLLPRAAIALLCGAALALAGTVFQHVLRNRLAEPTTLGVSSGAYLALMIATLYLPASWTLGREAAAFGGAAVALVGAFFLAGRRGFLPLSLVLAGMIVGLLCNGLATGLSLLYPERLQSVFIWGSGSLVQNDWSPTLRVLPVIVIAFGLVGVLVRPLAALHLEDGVAGGLGISVRTTRIAALVIAVLLSSSVASAIGVIGFVGLVAPTLARLAGVRRFHAQLVWSPLLGAGLLWLTDQLVQSLGPEVASGLPTGIVAALLGAPIMLWQLAHIRSRALVPAETGGSARPSTHGWALAGLMVVLLLAAACVALYFGRGLQGWHLSSQQELEQILRFRWPRVLAAFAAGAMLGGAGTMVQRLTGNPMASPEVLGISSGAGLGVILAILMLPAAGPFEQAAAGILGAFLAFAGMLALARRSHFSPEHLLLIGVAVSVALSAVGGLLTISGDPRLQSVLVWMSGSTYLVSANGAVIATVMAAVALPATLLAARWLDILPLGEPAARALGLSLGWVRFALLSLIAMLTAAGTMVVGPLSFVGLMAPQIARLLGVTRATQQMLCAALAGGLLMIVADWLGRTVMFPFQIPAGLLATLIGAPCFMILMRRERS
jgi:iron complex transport system permease protein